MHDVNLCNRLSLRKCNMHRRILWPSGRLLLGGRLLLRDRVECLPPLDIVVIIGRKFICGESCEWMPKESFSSLPRPNKDEDARLRYDDRFPFDRRFLFSDDQRRFVQVNDGRRRRSVRTSLLLLFLLLLFFPWVNSYIFKEFWIIFLSEIQYIRWNNLQKIRLEIIIIGRCRTRKMPRSTLDEEEMLLY